jgi:hypothetical protein
MGKRLQIWIPAKKPTGWLKAHWRKGMEARNKQNQDVRRDNLKELSQVTNPRNRRLSKENNYMHNFDPLA